MIRFKVSYRLLTWRHTKVLPHTIKASTVRTREEPFINNVHVQGSVWVVRARQAMQLLVKVSRLFTTQISTQKSY